jgi:hypothetical protein
LLGRKAAITEFYFPADRRLSGMVEKPVQAQYLLFGIVEEDTNKDGFLTELDAITAYVSDLAGQNMRSISPKGTQMLSWNFDELGQTVFLTIVEDTNADCRFDITDQARMIAVDLVSGREKQPVVDGKVIDKVKSLVF